MEFELLSKDSLVRMLNHAFGPSIGVLGTPEFSRVLNFLAFDIMYAPLSVIQREIKRAMTMELVKMDELTRELSFTESGMQFIQDNDMDGVNPKFYKAIELEAKGMNSLAASLRAQVDKEGLFWWPPEWPGRDVKITIVTRTGDGSRPDPEKKQVQSRPTTGDEIKVTKKPPRPVRL